MTGISMTEEEARRLFVDQLMASRAQGPAPDCEERLAAILAEHDAECAAMRQAEREKTTIRKR